MVALRCLIEAMQICDAAATQRFAQEVLFDMRIMILRTLLRHCAAHNCFELSNIREEFYELQQEVFLLICGPGRKKLTNILAVETDDKYPSRIYTSKAVWALVNRTFGERVCRFRRVTMVNQSTANHHQDGAQLLLAVFNYANANMSSSDNNLLFQMIIEKRSISYISAMEKVSKKRLRKKIRCFFFDLGRYLASCVIEKCRLRRNYVTEYYRHLDRYHAEVNMLVNCVLRGLRAK